MSQLQTLSFLYRCRFLGSTCDRENVKTPKSQKECQTWFHRIKHFDFFAFGGGRGLRTALLYCVSAELLEAVIRNVPNRLIKNVFEVTLGQGRAF